MITGWEWLAIGTVLLLFFGGRRIPALMKATRQSIEEFRHGKNEKTK